ncbi:hypothetical protein BJ878DRAFT_87194 [Calycina marina]|uniref:BZIP domain-containing protein n=1 Tax=Calycina marina TaxID=1763456 RepID=A0A9P7Z2H4_9HELO|nr:hypothetical protein BJ878DRAFT_87194 [Calycina marina]
MTERRQLRISQNASVRAESPPPKRPRKASIRNADDDKQRERKRALDRKAQRASREKIRSHIAHLEKMVQILSDRNGNTDTSELMEEMNRLHAEIDRLRKIIDSIKSVLGANIFEPTIRPAPARQTSQSPGNDPKHGINVSRLDNIHHEIIFNEVNSPAKDDLISEMTVQNAWGNKTLETDLGELRMLATEQVPVNDYQAENSRSESDSPKDDSIEWSTELVGGSGNLINRWEETNENQIVEHTILWNRPSLLKFVRDPEVPAFTPCGIWVKANSIYANIFKYSRDRMLSANKAEVGSLVKAVKEGWGSLTLKERWNPVLQILKEVDQNLFWDLDPVTKIANLYKSMLLLKYYFNADAKNLENIPSWQRPVNIQKTRKHPIPIDFFPWPALRDHLVRHHNYYFATQDFSVSYRQHFKFSWPFSFEDTYEYDSETQTYSLSPLFGQYHRDVTCWALEEVFFKKFPEFVGKITVYKRNLIDTRDETILAAALNGYYSAMVGDGGDNANAEGQSIQMDFGSEDVTGLFDNYPST